MTLTVVVVEDDPETLDFLQLVLSMGGAHVVASDYTGDVAALIRETQPDMALLDLQNGSDRCAGLAVLEQLRRDPATAATPVTLMTADFLALAREAARLQQLRATVLKKPFGPDELERLVEQTIA
jgi:CheY-like chemotaxis protein